MTNPVLNNNISTDSVILWQYDKAYNLIRLIQAWNEFAKVSCTDFWNYFGNSIFPIDRADTFGLNAWGNMLGIPRPTIHIPKYIIVPTCCISQQGALAFHIDTIDILLQGVLFVGGVEDGLLRLVETEHIENLECSLRELLEILSIYVI